VFALAANTRGLVLHPLLTVGGGTSPPVTVGMLKTNTNNRIIPGVNGSDTGMLGFVPHPNLRTFNQTHLWRTGYEALLDVGSEHSRWESIDIFAMAILGLHLSVTNS
jgi:hypothetical protein